MRYFLRKRVPAGRVLLVESGSRHVLERPMHILRAILGQENAFDVITCYPGQPQGLPPEHAVYRVTDYPDPAARGRLFAELKQQGYAVMAILCTGEPIMTKWKWALTARLPVKVVIINENGDFFWLDRAHWRVILRFALDRSGFSGANSVRTLARLAAFPFTLAYLLLFAGAIHLRRKIHG